MHGETSIYTQSSNRKERKTLDFKWAKTCKLFFSWLQVQESLFIAHTEQKKSLLASNIAIVIKYVPWTFHFFNCVTALYFKMSPTIYLSTQFFSYQMEVLGQKRKYKWHYFICFIKQINYILFLFPNI